MGDHNNQFPSHGQPHPDNGDSYLQPLKFGEFGDNREHASYNDSSAPYRQTIPQTSSQDTMQDHDFSGYSKTMMGPVSTTAIAVRPTTQAYEPSPHPDTERFVQYAKCSHLNHPIMSAGVEYLNGPPATNFQVNMSSGNHYQEQATYTSVLPPQVTFPPVNLLPFKQSSAEYDSFSVYPQPITQNASPGLNAASAADPTSSTWSEGICRHGDCLTKPPRKQKAYKDYADFRGHWNRVHNKQFECPLHNYRFGTAAELRRHEEAMHQTGAKRFSCHKEGCQARARDFNRKDKYQEHMSKWHGPYVCPARYCVRGQDNGFGDQGLLLDHMQKRHIDSDFL
ncbi:hypothetical protein NHQ30_006536 [Ciborinia camelliae]|nr:hypothetical protein NHQ30_006536 [Ciborinia camelliae]